MRVATPFRQLMLQWILLMCWNDFYKNNKQNKNKGQRVSVPPETNLVQLDDGPHRPADVRVGPDVDNFELILVETLQKPACRFAESAKKT